MPTDGAIAPAQRSRPRSITASAPRPVYSGVLHPTATAARPRSRARTHQRRAQLPSMEAVGIVGRIWNRAVIRPIAVNSGNPRARVNCRATCLERETGDGPEFGIQDTLFGVGVHRDICCQRRHQTHCRHRCDKLRIAREIREEGGIGQDGWVCPHNKILTPMIEGDRVRHGPTGRWRTRPLPVPAYDSQANARPAARIEAIVEDRHIVVTSVNKTTDG